MVALWIMIVILSLFSATAGALIALRLQYRILEEGRQERDAWREAQEGRQRTWEVRQAKRNVEIEKQLANQFKDLYKEWQRWQQDWYELAEQEQQNRQIRAHLEQEIARLPHIEDVELPLNTHTPHQQPERWQPPMLAHADLRGRDLSHRYMSHADLREAQLMRADLYMTDLTGANLVGANLEGANLAGANLCGADLRGANLQKANLLVADLHQACLQGASLLETRGLTLAQLHNARYDGMTRIDNTIHSVSVSTPGVQITPEEATHTPSDEALSIMTDINEETLSMPRICTTAQPEISATEAEVNPQEDQLQEAEQAIPTQPQAEQVLSEQVREQNVPEPQDEFIDTEEVPSHKIAQSLVHASTTNKPLSTSKGGSKTKGKSQVSTLPKKQRS